MIAINFIIHPPGNKIATRTSKPVNSVTEPEARIDARGPEGGVEMRNKITSYRDLDVYQNTYSAAIRVFREVLPKLPGSEKYDLKDQLGRACKAAPRLIAEGYAKKHQKMGFQKYLDDAMAECNEMVVSLSQCRDIYNISCEDLIDIYDKSGRQLYNLSMAWINFKTKGRRTS
jgi:four helix bundle protein